LDFFSDCNDIEKMGFDGGFVNVIKVFSGQDDSMVDEGCFMWINLPFAVYRSRWVVGRIFDSKGFSCFFL